MLRFGGTLWIRRRFCVDDVVPPAAQGFVLGTGHCSANHGPLQLGCSGNRAADSRELEPGQPKLGEHLGVTFSRATSSHVKRSRAVLKMFETISIPPCNTYRRLFHWLLGSYHRLTNLCERD